MKNCLRIFIFSVGEKVVHKLMRCSIKAIKHTYIAVVTAIMFSMKLSLSVILISFRASSKSKSKIGKKFSPILKKGKLIYAHANRIPFSKLMFQNITCILLYRIPEQNPTCSRTLKGAAYLYMNTFTTTLGVFEYKLGHLADQYKIYTHYKRMALTKICF